MNIFCAGLLADEARRLLHGSRILNRVQHPRKQFSLPLLDFLLPEVQEVVKNQGAHVSIFFRPFIWFLALHVQGRDAWIILLQDLWSRCESILRAQEVNKSSPRIREYGN